MVMLMSQGRAGSNSNDAYLSVLQPMNATIAHSEHTATVAVMAAKVSNAPASVIIGSSSPSSPLNKSWWVRSWKPR
jgi:hypothetical protein